MGRFEQAIQQTHGIRPRSGRILPQPHPQRHLAGRRRSDVLPGAIPRPASCGAAGRPFATKASTAGIFIWENGKVNGEASSLEFPFRSSELGAGQFAEAGGHKGGASRTGADNQRCRRGRRSCRSPRAGKSRCPVCPPPSPHRAPPARTRSRWRPHRHTARRAIVTPPAPVVEEKPVDRSGKAGKERKAGQDRKGRKERKSEKNDKTDKTEKVARSKSRQDRASRTQGGRSPAEEPRRREPLPAFR